MESVHELFDRLYRDMRPELMRLAGQGLRVRGLGLAEDVVDEAYLRLWDTLTSGDIPEEPEEWLRRRVRTRARNQRRKTLTSWRQERPSGLLLSEDTWPGDAIGPTDPYPPLDFETAEFRADFDAAVRALPDEERDVFILTELRGLSARAAAGVVGTSPDTAERRAEAAHTFIRKELT